MAGNNVTIDAKLNEKGVVSGAKQIKVSLEEIKKADGSLNWSGVKEGESAAKKSGDGFTVLKGILANLATAGIAAAAGAVKNFCSEVVQIGQTFETSMSKVSALSGATGDELAALEAKARELGASTTFSASQAADALGYMALAGWDTQQMLEGVGSVLTLAQAGEMDLAAASDLVTDYLSAFNMEASETARMVDVLAFAQANANTTVDGLGQAFKNCAANANAAGMDVETTSAAISMMANQGLKGSEAGTALNAVLRDMTAKMEDGAIAIGDQSVAVMDAQGNYRDFTEILADVQAATDGMGEAEKAAALQSTFTADSIKGLNLMLNAGADEMVGFREELYGCAGTAEETAAIMTDNLGGDIAAMGSAFEELSLKVYDYLQEPLRSAVQFITGTVVPGLESMLPKIEEGAAWLAEFGSAVADKFREPLGGAIDLVTGTVLPALQDFGGFLADEIGGNMETVTGIIDAAIPVLAALGGGLIAYKTYSMAVATAEKARAVATTAVDTATKLLNGTMRLNPIGIVITLIGALVAAFVYLWNTSDEFRSFWMGVWESVKAAVQPVADWVMANVITPLVAHFQEFQGLFSALWDAIVGAVTSAWEQIAPIVQAGMAVVQGIISAVTPVVQAVWEACWGVVSAVATTIWANISNTVETVMGVIQGIIQVVTGIISGDWDAVWSGVKQVFESIINGILQAGANVFNALTSIISSALTGIYNIWASIWNSVFSTVSSIWSSITSTVMGAVQGIWSNITGTFGNLVGTVMGIFDSVKNAITNPIETAKNTLRGIIDTIKGFFSNFHIQLPHINLPHFAISPSGWQIGDLLKGSIPSLSIEWYAKGGIFNSAQIIGIGEAGPEAVVPLAGSRMKPFSEAVAHDLDAMGGRGIDEASLARAIVKALAQAGVGKTVIMLDGKTVGEALAPYLDQINGSRYSNARRGLAL
ncbi:phage tail tape measure protein [Adlercreutzia equolifaciens]|uniref:phage tail tape measure protein n=1 Tax=Adlercreutzia rubneri TaxID=2916441 RepID=UPI001D06D34C|nr:phage tail tape measure protein [Adlercreutzia rubneri]MCB6760057.1 phage tail tape measure protein [Adlercreutzia equolifaciens]MCB6975724.1 phage tail tape measure protein [Adlercreutzia equolifaciens]MDE8683868.1 phage tail tape measure protein [Adlercreutzia rubneri]